MITCTTSSCRAKLMRLSVTPRRRFGRERNERKRDPGHSAGDSRPVANSTQRLRRDRTHLLYLAVLAAVVAGIVVGLAFPSFGKSLAPLGTGFVNLIKMMISPVIFCTIVLGIGAVSRAAKVGRVGTLAIGYFLVMSTVALIIGLVVGNLLHPGAGLGLSKALSDQAHKQATGAQGTTEFLLG